MAKLAGVSQASVSRVFSNNMQDSVKPVLKEKILDAANKLGYVPNMLARGMISGKTNVIGLVLGDGIGPFYNSVILRIIDKVQQLGKQCLVFKINKRENIDTIITRVLQFQVEGIIITSPAIAKSIEKICLNQNIPVILFNRPSETYKTSAVYTDATKGGALAAEYFLDHGHTNIGFIGYNIDTFEETEKKESFFSILEKNGIINILSETSAYDYISGYHAGIRLIPQLEKPCAIFCTSDLIAIGIMDAAKYFFSLKVPDEVSILGYDDILMSSWEGYKLDTIKQPFDKLVDKTVSVLFNKINKSIEGYEVIDVDLSIVKRGSVMNLNLCEPCQNINV